MHLPCGGAIYAGTGGSKRDILVFFTHAIEEYPGFDAERVFTPRSVRTLGTGPTPPYWLAMVVLWLCAAPSASADWNAYTIVVWNGSYPGLTTAQTQPARGKCPMSLQRTRSVGREEYLIPKTIAAN